MAINKIRRILMEEGFTGIWIRIRNRIYTKVNVLRFHVSDMPEILDNPAWKDWKMVQMTEEFLQEMINEYGEEISEQKRQVLRSRIMEDSTDIIYVVLDEKAESLGYYCVAYGDHYDDVMDYWVRKEEGCVHYFDAYTFKDHRNRGAQKFSVLRTVQHLQELRYTSLTIMIVEGNTYSQKMADRIGFKKYREILSINLCLKIVNFVRNVS